VIIHLLVPFRIGFSFYFVKEESFKVARGAMGELVAAVHTATNALQALGRGFDVNFDTRLLYCKGVSGSRVVEIDEEHRRELFLYDDVAVPDVSRDIGCSQEAMERQSSGVCTFPEVRLAVEFVLFL